MNNLITKHNELVSYAKEIIRNPFTKQKKFGTVISEYIKNLYYSNIPMIEFLDLLYYCIQERLKYKEQSHKIYGRLYGVVPIYILDYYLEI